MSFGMVTAYLVGWLAHNAEGSCWLESITLKRNSKGLKFKAKCRPELKLIKFDNLKLVTCIHEGKMYSLSWNLIIIKSG